MAGTDLSSFGSIVGITTYGERDLVITLVCRHEGKLSLFARSARTSRRRFRGTPDLFETGSFEYQLKTRGMPVLTSFEPSFIFRTLRSDLGKYTIASVLCECYASLIPEHSQGEDEITDHSKTLADSLSRIDSAPNLAVALETMLFAVAHLLESTGFHSFDEPLNATYKSLEYVLSLVEAEIGKALLSRSALTTLKRSQLLTHHDSK